MEISKESLIKWAVIGLIVSIWLFGSFLPKRAANNFLEDIGARKGFEKLVETSPYEGTKNMLNIVEIVNKNLDQWMDSAMGYKLYESYSTNDDLIQKYDEVDIYSPDGEIIASGIYEGLWSSNIAYIDNEYHIITVKAPQKKGKYSALFKMPTGLVTLKKK